MDIYEQHSALEREYLGLKASYENAAALAQTDTKKVVVLNFKALQLLRIKSLQQELFTMQMRFTLGGFAAEEYPAKLELLDTTLSNYGKALQNYELLSQNTLDSVPEGSSLFGAPEELIIKPLDFCPRSNLDYLLRRNKNTKVQYSVKNWLQFTQLKDKAAGGDYILNESLQYRELDKDGQESRAKKNAFSERLRMALFGGLALLVPVIIMTLVHGQTASLVTTSVATVLFAFALAIFANDTSGKDILAATAAYAAVLVVFVGTSITGPPSGSG
ncbi:hypothetical protein V8E51_015867 [Hyaloscypha variabilis]